MAGLPGLGTEDRWIDPPGRGDAVAGLLGPFPVNPSGAVRAGPDHGVAQADQEQPLDLGRRRSLVRRPRLRVGVGQRLGVEPLLLVGCQLRPVPDDPGSLRLLPGLRLAGLLLLFLLRRAVASASARSARLRKPAGDAKSFRMASAR